MISERNDRLVPTGHPIRALAFRSATFRIADHAHVLCLGYGVSFHDPVADHPGWSSGRVADHSGTGQ